MGAERVVHFEVMVDDPDKMLGFYNKVFGWQSSKWEGPMDYWLINTGENEGGINGGFARKPDAGSPGIINVVGVDSVDDSVQKVESEGGHIAMAKMAIPGVGWVAYGLDPEGNMFGMMESDESAA